MWEHTATAQRVIAGRGAIDRLVPLLREVGIRRPLIVSSKNRLESDAGMKLTGLLAKVVAATFDGASPANPTTSVQRALGIARDRDVDGVVSFGGGSAAELAKAVAYLVEHETATPGTSYTDKPLLPHVAIPTTGSPCAYTGQLAMTEPQSGRTTTVAAPTAVPVAVVADPDLAVEDLGLDEPPVAAVFGALGAAVEALWSPQRTPEAVGLAMTATSLLRGVLGRLAEDAADVGTVGDALAASALAGRASQNAPGGAAHGLARLVAGRCGIPYGEAVAVLLPAVVRYTAEREPAIGAAVGRSLGDVGDPGAPLDDLRRAIGVADSLGDMGAKSEDLDAVARMAEGHPGVHAHPCPVGEQEAREILAGTPSR